MASTIFDPSPKLSSFNPTSWADFFVGICPKIFPFHYSSPPFIYNQVAKWKPSASLPPTTSSPLILRNIFKLCMSNNVTAGFLAFYNGGEVQLSFEPPLLLMLYYLFLLFACKGPRMQRQHVSPCAKQVTLLPQPRHTRMMLKIALGWQRDVEWTNA